MWKGKMSARERAFILHTLYAFVHIPNRRERSTIQLLLFNTKTASAQMSVYIRTKRWSTHNTNQFPLYKTVHLYAHRFWYGYFTQSIILFYKYFNNNCTKYVCSKHFQNIFRFPSLSFVRAFRFVGACRAWTSNTEPLNYLRHSVQRSCTLVRLVQTYTHTHKHEHVQSFTHSLIHSAKLPMNLSRFVSFRFFWGWNDSCFCFAFVWPLFNLCDFIYWLNHSRISNTLWIYYEMKNERRRRRKNYTELKSNRKITHKNEIKKQKHALSVHSIWKSRRSTVVMR